LHSYYIVTIVIIYFNKSLLITLLHWFYIPSSFAQECTHWKDNHPEWIFCDDFESHETLVGPGRYFESTDNVNVFAVTDKVGFDQSRGIRIHWQKGK